MKKTREGWEGSNMYKMREGEKSVTGRGGGGGKGWGGAERKTIDKARVGRERENMTLELGGIKRKGNH